MFPPQLPDDESFLNPQATLQPRPIELPQQAPAWAQLLPALFSIGARIGGNKEIGPAAQQGYQQGVGIQQQQRAQSLREQVTLQDQDLQQQRQNALIQQNQLRQQQIQEQQRQVQLKAVVDDLRQQKFPTKKAYDAAVTQYETQLQMRPNTLRTMVPYNGPTAESDARSAIDTLVKTHGAQILASGGFVEFDRDGDGIPERVSITDAAQLAQYPLLKDEQGAIITPPKEVKAESQSEFAQRLASALDVFRSEKGREPTAKEKDDIMTRVSRTPRDPTLDAISQFALTQAQRNASTRMYSPGQERAVNMLADDYARDSKDFITRAQSYDTVIGASKDPSPAGDISMIFAYMKMLDPGSVVREGEQATAKNAVGVPDYIRNLYNLTMTGQRLTPTQRADFIKQAGNIYATSKSRQDRIVGAYTQRASRRGLDPNDVIVDYSAAGPASSRAPAAAPSDPTRARARQILQQGGYDTSDASIDKFLSNPKNKALLGVK